MNGVLFSTYNVVNRVLGARIGLGFNWILEFSVTCDRLTTCKAHLLCQWPIEKAWTLNYWRVNCWTQVEISAFPQANPKPTPRLIGPYKALTGRLWLYGPSVACFVQKKTEDRYSPSTVPAKLGWKKSLLYGWKCLEKATIMDWKTL